MENRERERRSVNPIQDGGRGGGVVAKAPPPTKFSSVTSTNVGIS